MRLSKFAKWGRRFALLLCLTVGVITISCAPKREYRPVTVPEWDVVLSLRPELPPSFSERDRRRFDEAWTALVRTDLATAASILERLDKAHSGAPELAVALGLIELRTGNTLTAQSLFDSVAADSSALSAARAGSFLTALAVQDPDAAYRELVALEMLDSGHLLVKRHLRAYQLSVAERHLQTARRLMKQDEFRLAVEAYDRALDIAPEAGALYLEAAQAALAAEAAPVAISHARKAVELDSESFESLEVLASALESVDELQEAIRVLESAELLRPGDADLQSRVRRLVSRFERTNLPPEYGRIPEATQLTRAQLAALLYVSLSEALEELDVEDNVLATDINESWAVVFIRRTIAKRILEVYPNHTFQPTAYVSRVELATALSMAFQVLRSQEYLQLLEQLAATFSDLPPENVNHQAAALSVFLELLGTGDDGAFEPSRLVSGAEAAKAVDALARKLQS